MPTSAALWFDRVAVLDCKRSSGTRSHDGGNLIKYPVKPVLAIGPPDSLVPIKKISPCMEMTVGRFLVASAGGLRSFAGAVPSLKARWISRLR